MSREKHIGLHEARAALGAADGTYVDLWKRGTLRVELYEPVDVDEQSPHDQDEIYVVQRGSGNFLVDGKRRSFQPRDFLFVAAGVGHRFVDFTDDLSVWVVFYGPPGGEGTD